MNSLGTITRRRVATSLLWIVFVYWAIAMGVEFVVVTQRTWSATTKHVWKLNHCNELSTARYYLSAECAESMRALESGPLSFAVNRVWNDMRWCARIHCGELGALLVSDTYTLVKITLSSSLAAAIFAKVGWATAKKAAPIIRTWRTNRSIASRHAKYIRAGGADE